MGQFIDQDNLGFSRQGGINIQFREQHALVFALGFGDNLQTLEQGIGFCPAVGLDIGGHHVPPFQFPLPGRLQHGVGFANPGGIPQENLQLPPFLTLFLRLGRLNMASGEGRISSWGILIAIPCSRED